MKRQPILPFFLINLLLFLFLAWSVQSTQSFVHVLDQWGMNTLTAASESSLTKMSSAFTQLGSYNICLTFGFILSLWAIQKENHWLSFCILAGSASTRLISVYLKGAIDRDRPPMETYTSFHGAAFPSGHALYALFIYGMIVLLLSLFAKKRILCISMTSLAVAIIILIGWSRVYLGAHYLTDVMGGWFIGGAWLSFIWFVGTLRQK
ncbi:undecaprenyl-diphosphatase [Halobacillus karajensis]|uniref:phosphatase PAP2 family protein n=1 Tax=Halobacillus karajensis TaxID=195088 RepID=UPI0008A7F4D3|nr:phosphatase PAP2 family protein [Halobacillus karajensis]SEI01724.1 undecaprenyl-diphosphatase [Halobacillus karajensis]